MSLYDLQNQVNATGAKAYTEAHDHIMKEGASHNEAIAKQGELKLAKELKTLQKTLKDIKGRPGIR